MNILGKAVAQLRQWRNRQVAATGIVVSRRVECEASVYVVCIDVHFEYGGNSHQARIRAAEFDDLGRAQSALLQWPIGSYLRLSFEPGLPEAVSLV